MNEKDLLTLKKKIDQMKDEMSELVGQKNYLLKDLKENWGCKTLEDVTDRNLRFKEEIERLEEQLDETLEKIKEMQDA